MKLSTYLVIKKVVTKRRLYYLNIFIIAAYPAVIAMSADKTISSMRIFVRIYAE